MNKTISRLFTAGAVTATLLSSTLTFGADNLLRPQVLEENLSPLWAQEYIGSDLIREELAQYETSMVDLAVIDLGFEEEHITLSEGFENIDVPFQRNGNRRMRANHGTSVVNLLTGPSNLRVTDSARLIDLTAASFSGMYSYAYRRYEKNNHYPKVISNSLGWSDERIPDVVAEMEKKGTLWFLAAGNSFPDPVKKLEIESQAMLVGSFSPSGLTSYEAQNHANLFILAPADTSLQTINGYGELHMFGASSGATPLVAGTVINLLALRPQLNKDQIKTLIQNTAFPSAENKLNLKDMPGLLNGYKAFKVLERLHNRCGESEECFANELKRASNFDFTFDSSSHNQHNCFRFMESSESKREVLLKELRRLSFLGSKFHQMETACAYRTLGLLKNAEFFDFISNKKLNLEHMEDQAKRAHDEAIYQISYYRYGPYYSKQYLKHLEDSPMKEYHKKMLKKLEKKHIQGK